MYNPDVKDLCFTQRLTVVDDVQKNLEISLLLDFYGDLLTEKQREVTEMYYNDDMSLSEIAEIVGITRQGVRDAIKRSEQVMTEFESKVGFCAKYLQIREGLDTIVRVSHGIAAQNKGYSYSKITDDGIKEIISVSQKLLD